MLKNNHVATPESVYTWGFYPEQSPLTMDYVAKLRGIKRPKFNNKFTYCDLGCANAVTLNTLAATMTQGQFYGVDINPKHISNAKALSSNGGLKNVQLLETSFFNLLKKDLPKFDYIALHGIASWVDSEVLQDIFNVIEKFLKPNGLVYINYNVMPGCADAQPLQALLKTCDDLLPDADEKTRLQNSLKIIKKLMQDGVQYLQSPRVRQRAERLFQQNPAYLIHEYIVDSWRPFYFQEFQLTCKTLKCVMSEKPR